MRNPMTLVVSMSLATAALAGVLTVAPTPAAAERRLGRPVKTAGGCSDGTTTFTLKSQFDDEPFAQTVGAEFEVDSGVIGQTWQVTLTDNGVVFFDQPGDTTGPEGALNVTHPDQGAFAIAHTIVARAVNAADGAVCTGQVTDQPR
jgi:hypothetical protein